MNGITNITLPSGLRAVHMLRPRAAVSYCGVAVRAGSRDELSARGEDGLAHFVEHTIFKGTERRRSYHIINRMERVGGELNAFTTKEDTVVYTAFPRGNTDRALELLSDLVCNSRFPEAELNKERDVVADEIDSYLDTPSEAVFDDFEDLIFAGTPLGHNILGTQTSLIGFDSAMCRAWLDKCYCANRMTVFYAGHESAEVFTRKVERYMAQVRAGGQLMPAIKATEGRSFDKYRVIESHQAHTVMGAVVVPQDNAARLRLALLSNILGGPGMNSLLNVDLRERRGLVYSVDTSVSNYTDCSLFNVYFGCDPADTDKCLGLVRSRIEAVANGEITAARLHAAVRQYLGQLTLAAEAVENRITSLARTSLTRTPLTTAEVHDLMHQITPAQLAETAQPLTALARLTLGPK